MFRDRIDQGDPKANEFWNIEIARVNTCMDFLFIALYWGVFSLLARLQSRWAFVLVVLFISLAAAFDIAENVRLLQALHGVILHESQFPVPGFVSQAKWWLFAISTSILGIALLAGKKLWLIVMSILMFGSAALTAAGISHLILLVPAIILLFISFVIAILYYFPFGPFTWEKFLVWVEFAYLIRFQLIGALLLAIVLPACYFLFPSIFIGLYDALGFRSFVFVLAASLQFAWTVMITSRLVLVYGPDRFPSIRTLRAKPRLPWSTALLFLGLAAPCIVMTCCGTMTVVWWEELAGIVLAVSIAVALLWLTAELHSYVEPGPGTTARSLYPSFPSLKPRRDTGRSYFGKGIDRTLRAVLPGQTHPGLVTPEGRLRSGHQLAATTLVVSIAVYAAVGIYFSPSAHNAMPAPEIALQSIATSFSSIGAGSEHPPAAMFYLLYLLTLLTLVFSGVAFVFDRVRLPVLTTTIAFSFLVGIKSTDHHFDVQNTSVHEPVSAADAVHAWEKGRGHDDPRKPIVVVATAGGGIRAASWTSQVLTGLAEGCKTSGGENNFSSSLLLVSSVSGGSVGNMYVVGSYDSGGNLHEDLMKVIRDDAARTSLSAVGWGILYPDFVRTVPLVGSFLAAHGFGEDIDRGWALETQWLDHWDGRLWKTPPTISEWSKDVASGKRPAVIFNATAAESGQRFVIASTSIRQHDQSTIQFATAFPQYDVGVSTAARLSATFPWVSPMARAADGKVTFGVHVADGGYYDNSGILSASQWLLEAAGAIKRHPVLFIVIDSTPATPAEGKSWSWQRQAIGPVEALLSVRDSSQQARADFEMDLALEQLKQTMDIEDFHFLYPAGRLTPLSWHLTPEQQSKIGEAWSDPDESLRTQLRGAFRRLGCSQ
jgi:hypothetical protein